LPVRDRVINEALMGTTAHLQDSLFRSVSNISFTRIFHKIAFEYFKNLKKRE